MWNMWDFLRVILSFSRIFDVWGTPKILENWDSHIKNCETWWLTIKTYQNFRLNPGWWSTKIGDFPAPDECQRYIIWGGLQKTHWNFAQFFLGNHIRGYINWRCLCESPAPPPPPGIVRTSPDLTSRKTGPPHHSTHSCKETTFPGLSS